MRNNTKQIYELLTRGAFLSDNSSASNLYKDIDENFEDYYNYFKELGLSLTSGDGYFYMVKDDVSKSSIDSKMEMFKHWIDVCYLLKTCDITFTSGYFFRKSMLVERITNNPELREISPKIYGRQFSYAETVDKIIKELSELGFIEIVNNFEESFKVTSAFRYMENLVNIISIFNEDNEEQS